MNKILFVNANRFKHPWPVMPFGLCCVASAVEKAGYQVKVLDLCFSSNVYRDIYKTLHEFKPQAIGTSIRNIDNGAGYKTQFLLNSVRDEVITPLKQLYPGPMVIGGPSVGINGAEMLEFLDLEYAIQGEGEAAMVTFLDRVFNNGELETVPGLIIRKEGHIVTENTPHRIPDLDTLPPARVFSYIDVHRYARYGSSLQVQTKRGCAMKCSYCTYNRIEGSAWRLRDPELVAREIKEMVEKTGIHQIEFTDSTFNLPLPHAKKVLRAIINLNMDLNLRTMGLNPGAVDEELAALMTGAGFSEVDLGVESGSDTTLKGLGKHFTRHDVLKAGRILHRHNISVAWYLLLGGPGESARTLKETFNTMDTAAAKGDLINVGVGLRVYNGAPVAENMRAIDPSCTRDRFFQPVQYAPRAISLNEIKYRTKSWALNRTNVFMYDEDETTAMGVMRVVTAIRKMIRSRRPMWQAFILIRWMQRLTGLNLVFKGMHAWNGLVQTLLSKVKAEAMRRKLLAEQEREEVPFLVPGSIIRYQVSPYRAHDSTTCSTTDGIMLATTREDLCGAYSLIYKQYHQSKYIDESESRMRVMVWNTLPGTYTVVKKELGRVVATVTYIMDSEASLPMDEVAGEQLDQLRRNGRRLCEVSGLAVKKEHAGASLLMDMFQYGQLMMTEFFGATDYVITVNPQHKLFYRRMLSFKQIGETVSYKKVKNAPGVPMRLNLLTSERTYHERYSRYTGRKNLHRFFFIDHNRELGSRIAANLQERAERMTMSFIHEFFVNECRILGLPEDYALFCRQWRKETSSGSKLDGLFSNGKMRDRAESTDHFLPFLARGA